MSVGDQRWHLNADGLPSREDYIHAIDLMRAEWIIVTGVDIPYCAGYSENGATIYIDRDVPEWATIDGVRINIWQYPLFVHESEEKILLARYSHDEKYMGCHTLATMAEHACVRVFGVDPAEYDAWWASIIEKIGARKAYKRVPADLDLTPYYDENDQTTLDRMTFVKL